jgi:hypothetical protein
MLIENTSDACASSCRRQVYRLFISTLPPDYVVTEYIRDLRKFMQRLRDTRYFTYIFISLWKMVCFFCCSLLILFLEGDSVPNFFLLFKDAFSARQIVVTEVSRWEYSIFLTCLLSNKLIHIYLNFKGRILEGKEKHTQNFDR